METAIVLTPNSSEELFTSLAKITESIDIIDKVLLIIVGSKEVLSMHEDTSNLNLIITEEDSIVRRQNMARQAAKKDIKYLLFLGMDEQISKEELERRIKFLEVEQLIGVVGDKAEVKDEFTQKTITHKLLTLLTLDKEEFDKRCCDEDGKMKSVRPDTLLTTVKMWDKIGGFPIDSEDSYSEYCARVQALGYTLFPLTS